MTKDQKKELMKIIQQEVIDLKESSLYEYRVKEKNLPVIGEGSHDSEIVFIGEAPGRNEAKTGKPFCGMAGKLLDELLRSVKLDRSDIYITNIVKDRPPMNRDPLPNEIRIYGPFLERQIEIICPKIIVTLGRFSMDYIMRKYGLESDLKSIGTIHGKVFETNIEKVGKVKVLPLYHPAAAIYNRELKTTLLKDFKVLKNVVNSMKNNKE